MLIINLRKKFSVSQTSFYEKLCKMTQFVRETNTYVGKVKLTINPTQRHVETVTKTCKWEKYHSFLTGTHSYGKLDPVGSTVRYEMRKLCTGSV